MNDDTVTAGTLAELRASHRGVRDKREADEVKRHGRSAAAARWAWGQVPSRGGTDAGLPVVEDR
jgi:hypothetical protein